MSGGGEFDIFTGRVRPTSPREVTPDELSAALQATDEFPGHEMDWPYIDEFVIDGGLEPLVGWLCQHYVIVPRPTPPADPGGQG